VPPTLFTFALVLGLTIGWKGHPYASETIRPDFHNDPRAAGTRVTQDSLLPATCDTAIQAIEQQTAQLVRTVESDVRDYIKNDVVETSLSGIRSHYKNNPTSEALFDLKDKWDKFNQYVDYLRRARVTLEDLQRCLATPGCALTEFAKRQHQAIAKWIQSLGNDSVNAATERVNKAARLIQNYADRSLNLAMRTAVATAEQCNARFEEAATGRTVATTAPAGPPSAAGQSSSRSGGNTALRVIGGAAAGALVFTTLREQQAQETGSRSTSTTSSTTTSPTTTSATTPTSCAHLGSSGSCSIQVQIDAAEFARSLTAARRFNVYSVPRNANPLACQLQTTVCFGVGCPNAGSTRQLGADLRGLGTMTDATVTIVPIDSGTPGQRSWNVNLTQCATIVRYP